MSLKINVRQIPAEGSIFDKEVGPVDLDLDISEFRFRGPIKIRADISRITNAVTIDVSIGADIYLNCSRCLNEIVTDFQKQIRLNYQVDAKQQYIDLTSDLREEIILDYPIKALCRENCKGLCINCGKNLNEGGCSCGST